ncbi:hypothetical protein MNBD_CHLOROFLEXI01-240, partial [hydrothermal vent metagenome]
MWDHKQNKQQNKHPHSPHKGEWDKKGKKSAKNKEFGILSAGFLMISGTKWNNQTTPNEGGSTPKRIAPAIETVGTAVASLPLRWAAPQKESPPRLKLLLRSNYHLALYAAPQKESPPRLKL